MLTIFKVVIIFCGIALLVKPVIGLRMNFNSDYRKAKDSDNPNKQILSDDEISYALSELSVDDLKALSQLMDAISEHDIQGIQGNNRGQMSLEEQARFKRENPRVEDDKDNQVPDVDEEYIKQLDESFPNVDDQSNQDDKEKEHVRVKRK